MVRKSSLYFLKARALRHTSALLRYNARSLRHWYERAQFTIHFIKEIKKTCSSSIVELYKHFGIFKNTREVLLRTSLVFLKIPTRLYNPTMHLARFYFFIITHVHSYCSSHLIFCLEVPVAITVVVFFNSQGITLTWFEAMLSCDFPWKGLLLCSL